MCEGGAQTLRISGANLQNATVTLGDSKQVASVSADGTHIDLAPGLTAGTYAVNVDTGLGCTAQASAPLVVVGRPQLSAVAIGPRAVSLADDFTPVISASALASAAITVRLSGVNLVSGARVRVGSATGTVMDATGTMLDARFATGAIAAGSVHASVSIGSCTVDSPGFSVVDGPLIVQRTNPNAVALPEAFLDLSGAFASAAHGPAFFIDQDPDPIAMDLHPLTYEARLHSDRNAFRVSLSSLPTLGTYDLFAVAKDALGVWQSGAGQALLQVTSSAPPRIVFREQEWLKSSGAQVVQVYGCRFAGAQFSLLDTAGVVVQTATANVTALSAARAWAVGRFACGPNDPATDLASLTFTGLAAGTYRLRASNAAGMHDDLYSLVVYSDAPTVSASASDPRALTTARVFANAARGFDETGRSFIYVFGGSSAVTLSPEQAGNAIGSYERSAIAPDGTLVGANASFAETARPLQQEPAVANQCPLHARGAPILEMMGASSSFDGPTLYLVGGQKDATQQVSDIRRGGIVNDAHEATLASAQAVPGGVGTIPAGHYYLAGSVIYPEGDARPYRELATAPVRVTLAQSGSISATITAPCGAVAATPPGTGGCTTPSTAYVGCPALSLYLSTATSDPYDESLPLETLAAGASGAWSFSNACPSCSGTWTGVVTISSTVAPAAPGRYRGPGTLQVMTTAQTLSTGTAGAAVALARDLDSRSLFVIGGYTGSSFVSGVTPVALANDGSVSSPGSPFALTTPLAFATAASWINAVGTAMTASGGVAATQSVGPVVAGGLPIPPFAETIAPPSVYSAGAALAGNRLFLLGGFEPGTNTNAGTSLLHDEIATSDNGAAFTPRAHLSLARAGAASVHVPPYIYVFGGAVCDVANQPSGCAFSDATALVPSASIEAIPLSP